MVFADRSDAGRKLAAMLGICVTSRWSFWASPEAASRSRSRSRRLWARRWM